MSLIRDYSEKLPKRKPTHLRYFDYGEGHLYFITICSYNRENVFSSISVGEGLAPPEIMLSGIGNIIEEQLLELNDRYKPAFVDKYIIMPNHIHMILGIEALTGGASPSPTTHTVICALKSLVTRSCRHQGIDKPIWQRGYFDHVIRNDKDYQRIIDYMDNNPFRWTEDPYYC